MLDIYSHYLMKLHDFFFFLQAHAGIFFSCSISCMNFFFGSDTPLPGYLMVHPLVGRFYSVHTVYGNVKSRQFDIDRFQSGD